MGFLQNLFGSKVKIPEFQQLDVDSLLKQNVAGNAGVLPAASTLAQDVNNFNQKELERLYEMALPSYNAIKNNASKSFEALSRGEIPTDISEAVQRNSAVRSLYGGYGNSGMSRNLVGRDLGLTSLALQQQGLASAERWLAATTAPRFDVTSMFLTPTARIGIAQQERDSQFNRDYLENQVKAMPDPVTVGLWNTGWSVVDAVLSAYTGSSVELGMVNPNGQTAPTSNYIGGNKSYGGASSAAGSYGPSWSDFNATEGLGY